MYVANPEFTTDRLAFNTFDGIDTLDSSQLAPGTIQVFFDGVPVP